MRQDFALPGMMWLAETPQDFAPATGVQADLPKRFEALAQSVFQDDDPFASDPEVVALALALECGTILTLRDGSPPSLVSRASEAFPGTSSQERDPSHDVIARRTRGAWLDLLAGPGLPPLVWRLPPLALVFPASPSADWLLSSADHLVAGFDPFLDATLDTERIQASRRENVGPAWNRGLTLDWCSIGDPADAATRDAAA